MKVAFRADASIEIGTGHVMRCLTLADRLRERGATTHFLCRPLDGHLGEIHHGTGPRSRLATRSREPGPGCQGQPRGPGGRDPMGLAGG